MQVPLYDRNWQEVTKVDVPVTKVPYQGVQGQVIEGYEYTPEIVIYLGRYFRLNDETDTYEESNVYVVPS